MKPNAITVCVEYDDILSFCLLQNAPQFNKWLIVTSPHDKHTPQLAKAAPNVEVFATDAFYRDGAAFNKGLAMEEGLDRLGREGWLLILDADIVLPRAVPWSMARIGNLYSPPRRILADPRAWRADLDWYKLPRHHYMKEFAGYFQLFHANDPVLKDKRPWYGTSWKHAGGCDAVFQSLWSTDRKIRPDFEVLHLGEADQNWCGRITNRLDGKACDNRDSRQLAMQQTKEEYSKHQQAKYGNRDTQQTEKKSASYFQRGTRKR